MYQSKVTVNQIMYLIAHEPTRNFRLASRFFHAVGGRIMMTPRTRSGAFMAAYSDVAVKIQFYSV